MFSGCPCEIHALKTYLNSDYDGLYTIELLCYGFTSPEYLRDFLSWLEGIKRSKIKYYCMRYKDLTKKVIPFVSYVEFNYGKKWHRQLFNTQIGGAFQIVHRRSCYSCNWKWNKSVSDITIGDAHNELRQNEFYNKEGTSVIIVNSQKGECILRNALILTKEIDLNDVIGNMPVLNYNSPINPIREAFIKASNDGGLIAAVRKMGTFLSYGRYVLLEFIVKSIDRLRSNA